MKTLEIDKPMNKPDIARACPNCGRPTTHIFNMKQKGNSTNTLWNKCSCGVIFQHDPPKCNIANEIWGESTKDLWAPEDPLHKNNKFFDVKKCDIVKPSDRLTHAASVYSPIIEDLTTGRQLLEIECNDYENKKFFNQRGWIYFGTTDKKVETKDPRIIEGNFEKLDLQKSLFNVIWIENKLQNFANPKNLLKTCHDILQEDGVLYLSSPDIDWIDNLSPAGWGGWNKDSYIFWNTKSISKLLEELGFEIIVSRRNMSMRYANWYDFHIIAQKIYF